MVISGIQPILFPEHDATMTKWRWHSVKQTGHKPVPRSGMSCTVAPNANKAYLFGGVQDDHETNMAEPDSDSEDESPGVFFNDLYSLTVENERATWQKIELTGKKIPGAGDEKKRRKAKDDEEADSMSEDDGAANKLDSMAIGEASDSTKVVESGAFTITSTVNAETKSEMEEPKVPKPKLTQADVGGPSPRFGSALTIRQGILYLFGGMVEDTNDRQLTFNDLYSLGEHITLSTVYFYFIFTV